MAAVYWWRKVRNFGDFLTDTLLTHLGIEHHWAEPDDADLVVTGSVLEHLPCCWPGKVIGAGKLHQDSILHLKHTDVVAVRGPLTAVSIGRYGSCAIGDPGLMASLMINPQPARYDLGVVPHWSDTELPLKYAYGHVIRPENGPMHVMTEIARCRRLVTSSLHGIIVADSFGIPRQAEIFPNAVKEGGVFKYEDYAASIGTTPRFGELYTANQRIVALRQREIEDALAQL